MLRKFSLAQKVVRVISLVLSTIFVIVLFIFGVPDAARKDKLLTDLMSRGVKAAAVVSDGASFNDSANLTFMFIVKDMQGNRTSQYATSPVPKEYFDSVYINQWIDILYLPDEPTFARVIGHEGTANELVKILLLGSGLIAFGVFATLYFARDLVRAWRGYA
jgi:hypothetical protein